VIHDDPVTRFESPAPFPSFHDLARRFMPRNDALISFGSFAKVFIIDATNIGTTYRRSLDAEQNLAVSRARHGNVSKLNCAVPW
jgi:hypothetical protein